MNFWRSSAGLIELELTSAVPEDAITAINDTGVEIFALKKCGDLSCRFQICRKHYRTIQALTGKRGETLKITGKQGIYWQAKSLSLRPVLLVGVCLWGCLILYLPSRIFFVHVTGNDSVPYRQILEAAQNSGVYFGASRRAVRSEKVKNAILSQIPQLQWVGVNTAGCVATVSVRERAFAEETEPQNQVSSIVANQDGFILSATVTRGNPVFQIGQAVKKGQVLVSGYTDCGISIQATRANAEIFAETNREINAITPENYSEIQINDTTHRKISLRFRKKRINLWKGSGISPTTCGRMYKEYYLTLPGGFQLPVALCLETFWDYDVQDIPLAQSRAEEALNKFVQSYLHTQMTAGRIVSGTHQIALKNDAYQLQGKYVCAEMIGKEQPEQIGELHGKNN